MPCGSESLHLAPWQESLAPIPPLKEDQALCLDPRSRISPREPQEAPLQHAHLGAPTEGEPLLLYVVATTQVVSATVVVERREEGQTLHIQRSVYFVSEVLSETKIYYPQV
jgi:hypothetical protein